MIASLSLCSLCFSLPLCVSVWVCTRVCVRARAFVHVCLCGCLQRPDKGVGALRVELHLVVNFLSTANRFQSASNPLHH